MNVQERDQLLQFLHAVQRSPALPRDAVAEALIQQKIAEGVSPYDLVQRALGLTLALQATQARLAQLQAQIQALSAHAAQSETAASVPRNPSPAAPESAAAASGQAHSLWSQGLLGQIGGTAVGVAAGVVAGGLLFEGLQQLLGEGAAAAPSVPEEGLADASPGLWDLGDDWT